METICIKIARLARLRDFLKNSLKYLSGLDFWKAQSRYLEISQMVSMLKRSLVEAYGT